MAPNATRRGDDRRAVEGQAIIETILIGLLLLAPLLWALGVLSSVHRVALAATSAARDAGFEAARSASGAAAGESVDAAVRQAFDNSGLDPAPARVRWEASEDLDRGSLLGVEVSYPVTVLQAPFIGSVTGPSIWIRARHVARVDPYASR